MSYQEIKLITDFALDSVICLDTTGLITLWNPRAEEMLGWKKEEILNRPFTNIIAPPYQQQVSELNLHTLEETSKGRFLEIHALHKAGNELPVLVNVTPAYQGSKIVWCAFIHDISELKQEEEKLRESERKYATLINTIDVIVWEVDIKTFMFTYVSAQAERLFGYPINDWITKPTFWADKIHPDDRDWAIDFCTQSIKARKSTYSFEYRMITADGRVVWLRDVVTLILEDGKPKQLRGILMDVTESRELEELLKGAEEKYRSIFENAAEGIYQSTPDGRFLAANPAMAKMFGFASPEELIDSVTDIGSQFYADKRDREAIVKQLEKDGRAIGVEFQCVKRNGELIWIRGHIRAIYDKDQRVKYYEGTLEDVTERKIAEDGLRAKLEEVQKTNYELDHFVYSVSHDLRAPVATVQGLINIAEKDNLSPASQKYIGMIRESIGRMEGFIKDILEYSRNSRLELGVEKINFNQLFTQVQNSVRILKGFERLKITLDIDESFDFYSDPVRLGIVLKNIMANSIRYQDTAKESYFSVRVTFNGSTAVITVKDNGIGIEPSQLGKIFNMFYRASEISTGAGLGLYIAREVVSKLGGVITVQSELGLSTMVEVCLPDLRSQKRETPEFFGALMTNA